MRRSRAERGFSIALGLFAVVLAVYLFLQSPFFCLETIHVSGTNRFSEAEIMAIGGLQRGQNLFDIDLVEVSARLLAEPVVKTAQVERGVPGTLRVALTEREPIVSIASDGVLWALDVEGRVLGEVMGPQGLPVISLAESPIGVVPGSYVNDPVVRMAVGVAADMPAGLALRVCEIRVSDTGELELITRDGVRVRLGAWRDMKEKMQVLDSLLQQAESRGARLSMIDVRHPDKPVVR